LLQLDPQSCEEAVHSWLERCAVRRPHPLCGAPEDEEGVVDQRSCWW
jgi:hypothetical protein